MSRSEQNWASRYEEYWRLEGRDAACRQLGGTCLFVLIAQFAFIALDRWVFPSLFPIFLAMRLGVNVVVCGILFWARHRIPDASQLAVPIVVALEILAMIFASGGSDSLYFAGLVIVLVGVPVLQPISVRGSLLISAICVGGFVASAAAFPDGGFDRSFVIQLVFILCAALESAFSCKALASSRLIAFEQRREIEKARDELATLDDAKNRFSANVHHELRTPLTLMLAPLESLRAGDHGTLLPEVGKTLQTMHNNGRRLLKLINNLLDLAKLESDRFNIIRREVRPEAVVAEIVEGAVPLARRKGIDLSCEPFEEVSSCCLDRDAFEKVVVNLVGNAVKFTDPGGAVSVSVVRAEHDDGFVLRVADSGIGLAAEDLDKIFDRFAQADGSATRTFEGTGIGLSLARELVELHGGRIWAESEGLGLGATVFAWFPVGELDDGWETDSVLGASLGEGEVFGERSRPEDSIGMNPRRVESLILSEIALDVERNVDQQGERLGNDGFAAREPCSGSTAQVVVADDNPDMRELLSFLLGREFEVCVAKNGLEALGLVREVRPDLVVTDIMMPEMPGTELCRLIKTDPQLSSTAVMLVSSKAEDEMKVQGLELGADDYVTKPFHPRELLARARGLVRVRILQRDVHERNEALEVALADLKAAEVRLVQSEKLAAVGELAAGIAHEVNNPVNFALNAVRALIGELRSIDELAEVKNHPAGHAHPGGEDPRGAASGTLVWREQLESSACSIRELSEIAVDGLERTRRLVGDLRDFAAPDRSPRVFVDLESGVRSTIALLSPTLGKTGCEILVQIPERLPTILGNPSAINQVFLNLLKNAAEALGNVGGTVVISADADSNWVRVSVEDDGPGVSPELAEQIFEPFVTTKHAGSGTGLGLSISRQIAMDHGGDLVLEAREGRLSTFVLTLPVDSNRD